jgi:hypothetical protein
LMASLLVAQSPFLPNLFHNLEQSDSFSPLYALIDTLNWLMCWLKIVRFFQ